MTGMQPGPGVMHQLQTSVPQAVPPIVHWLSCKHTMPCARDGALHVSGKATPSANIVIVIAFDLMGEPHVQERIPAIGDSWGVCRVLIFAGFSSLPSGPEVVRPRTRSGSAICVAAT
jgi:hypothetical protein